MKSISTALTEKFVQRNIIDPAKIEIYKTGIDLIVADLLNFSLIFAIGFLTKTFVYSCIYLLLFWTVRRYSGGFHAKTYTVCRITFVFTYIAMIFIGNSLKENWMMYTAICDIITIATMLLFSPIPHPNKKLTEREKKANRYFSLLTTLIYTLISMVLVIIGRKEGLIISLTLLAITVLMYAGMIVNAKGGITKCQNSQIKH